MRMKNATTLLQLRLIVLFTISASIGLAQSYRCSILGAITDPGGSSIPGASVTATNEATGAQNHTLATGAGEYTIPELPAGTYSLTVEAPGFTKLIHNGITVSVSLNVRLDLSLGVGAATTTVNVTSDAPLLKTENPENNITVTSTDFNSLPLNMAGVGAVRDPLSFAELAPCPEHRHGSPPSEAPDREFRGCCSKSQRRRARPRAEAGKAARPSTPLRPSPCCTQRERFSWSGMRL